ncbi:phytanoyl-CoA dioxygenase family protein [Arenicellales bacterium nBUS_48]
MLVNYPNISDFSNTVLSCNELSDEFKFAVGVALAANSLNDISRFWRNSYMVESVHIEKLPKIELVKAFLTCMSSKEDITGSSMCNLYSQLKERSPLSENPEMSFSRFKKHVSEIFNQHFSDVEKAANGTLHQARDITKVECEKIAKEVQEQGYSIIHNFYKKEFINELNDLVLLIAETEKKANVGHQYSDSDNRRVYNLAAKDSRFRLILENFAIRNVLEYLFNRDTLHPTYALSSFAANSIGPWGKAGNIHIDSMVPDPIPPWLMRCLVTIPLVDFTSLNGATRVIPLSHKKCSWPTDNLQENEISLSGEIGDLFIWDGLIWHCSGQNKTDQRRTALLVTFAASFFREIAGEEDHPQIIPLELARQFSPHVQQLLGFGRGIKDGANFNLTYENYNG